MSRRYPRFGSDPSFSERPRSTSSGLHRRPEPIEIINRDADRVSSRTRDAAPPRSSSSASWDVSLLTGGRSPGASAGQDMNARSQPGSERQLIRVSLDAGSELLENVHQFVTSFAGKRFGPSAAQAVGLASYELLSNGLRYASLFEPVVYELTDDGQTPEVRVTNAAVQSRINVLVDWVEQLNRNPQAVYVEEMRRSLGGSQRATLGLARVAHEAEMRVTVLIDGTRVSVRARPRR
jgi:hypothetical protein